MPKYDFSDFDEKPQYDFSDFDTPPDVSQIESGLRGAAQGASLGFADELTGLLESSAGSLGLVPDKTYEQARDESRAAYQAAQEANPLTSLAGNVVGGIGSALLAPGAALTVPGRIAQAAGMGAVTGYGMNENRDNALKDIALGGALGGVAGAAGEGLSAALQKIGSASESAAKGLIRKATGATGKQAEKFKPGTEEFLLNSPDIKAWYSPKQIAEKTSEMLNQSGDDMSRIISSLDETGVTKSTNELADQLARQAEVYRAMGPTKPLAKQIDTLVENIRSTGGESSSINPMTLARESQSASLKPSQIEAWKREYGDLIKNWVDPTSGVANKEAYDVFKNATEQIAENASPEIAQSFGQAKSQYGMLAPVHEAAAKRAGVLNQSPIGGLLDVERMQAGALLGNVSDNALGGGIAATIAGKVVAPRAANLAAHSANFVSKLIKTPPAALGKFAGIIQNAAVRGQNSVAVTDWLLEQSNPEYREMKKRLNP